MERKRRQPTSGFRMPPPYQPITGERADVIKTGVPTHTAMMQVAVKDEFKNYVICRGYDPRDSRFYHYDAEDLEDKPGIAVAKPYGNRTVGAYAVGEVFAAVIPLTRIGETSGVAAVSDGHPVDLDEEIEILYRDDAEDANADANPIAWLLIDAGPSPLVELMLAEDHPTQGIVFKCYRAKWCPQDHTYRYNCDDGCDEWVWAIDHRYDVPYPGIGTRGYFTPEPSNIYGTIWVCVSLDCSSRGSCAEQGIDQPCPEGDSTNYGGACPWPSSTPSHTPSAT